MLGQHFAFYRMSKSYCGFIYKLPISYNVFDCPISAKRRIVFYSFRMFIPDTIIDKKKYPQYNYDTVYWP